MTDEINKSTETSVSSEASDNSVSPSESILDKVLESRKVSSFALEPREVIESLISQQLDQREQSVLKQRHGLDELKVTLEEIGKKLGVTRERVRQIAKQALKKLKTAKQGHVKILDLDRRLKDLFDVSGGLREEKSLLREFFSGNSEHKQAPYLIFFLDNLSDYATRANLKKSGWQLAGAPVDLHQELENLILEHLQQENRPRPIDQIYEALSQQTAFRSWQERFASAWPGRDEHSWENVISAYLELSDALAVNPFAEWGLESSSLVKPRRMGDKIYLVLSKKKEPLHFNDITKLINEYKFDKRRAYGPTVHNELILDDRFVLVGRGIYALQEWGYREGTVADVLLRILGSATEPLNREELIESVLKERVVKEGTILLALTDKNKFRKLSDGRYQLTQ